LELPIYGIDKNLPQAINFIGMLMNRKTGQATTAYNDIQGIANLKFHKTPLFTVK
jgi:hypothetical protein